MNSTAMDIAGFLETGLWIRGTNLFVGLFPDLPVQAICVYDTMGTSPDRYQDPMKAPTEKPGVQITVRSATYDTGYHIARNVACALRLITNQTVVGDGDAVRYGIINQQGDILPLGKDERQRYTFSMSFSVVREQV